MILIPSIICHQYRDYKLSILLHIKGLHIVLNKLKKNLQESYWSFGWLWKLKSHYLTYFHLFSFIWWHSLSFFCYSLSFVVTCCHLLSIAVTPCHSLSLFAKCCPCCTALCHLLCYSLSLIVTRFTARLPFYKRSPLTFKHWTEIFISFYPKNNIIYMCLM